MSYQKFRIPMKAVIKEENINNIKIGTEVTVTAIRLEVDYNINKMVGVATVKCNDIECDINMNSVCFISERIKRR